MTTLNMSATELVARMLNVYANASSYADTGTASSLVGLLRVTFQTSFLRGRRFRFEYRKENDVVVIWSDGAHTYTHKSLARGGGRARLIDDGPDIANAIDAIGAASSATADTVPAMLLPVSVGAVCSRLANLGELTGDGDEHIGNHSCARVNGRGPGVGTATFWIDRNTYLLRRLVIFRGLKHETTTSYEPSLDEIDIGSIVSPDVEKIPPQPRERLRWTGIHIAMGERRIEAIDENSPAMRSGLAIGDEVEVVNGQRTDSFVDVVTAFHAVGVGEQIALKLRRGERGLEVHVPVEAAPTAERPVPSRPLVE